jgi:hypothetical protein
MVNTFLDSEWLIFFLDSGPLIQILVGTESDGVGSRWKRSENGEIISQICLKTVLPHHFDAAQALG